MENELKEELALLLFFGITGLKTTPYMKIFKDKFNIDKERYKLLKKMTTYELCGRYSFLDINETRKET